MQRQGWLSVSPSLHICMLGFPALTLIPASRKLACGCREDVEELELVEPGPLDGRSTATDGGEVLPEVNGHAGAGGHDAAGVGSNGGGTLKPPLPWACRQPTQSCLVQACMASTVLSGG